MKKCPKCKKVLKRSDSVYGIKKYQVDINVELDAKTGLVIEEDLEAGYTYLGDYIGSMLRPIGNPVIIGCSNCIK